MRGNCQPVELLKYLKNKTRPWKQNELEPLFKSLVW